MPAGPPVCDHVRHVVNFAYMKIPSQKILLVPELIRGAESGHGGSKGILFINYEQLDKKCS